MSVSVNANGYLQRKMAETSDQAMAKKWGELHEHYNKRRWHELTIELLRSIKEPSTGLQQSQRLIELYDNFIKEFEHRIKPLSFVEIAAHVAVQYHSVEEAIQFLDKCEKRVKTDKTHMDPLALSLLKIVRGKILLEKQFNTAELKALLEEIDEILTTQVDGITVVHGRFYQLQSKYFLATGNLTEYYKSALKFLGCTPLQTLPLEEQREHAKNLAVSSLVAEGIYNFGELLAHPVLDSLKRTSDEWLVDLMRAFNAGDVREFNALKKRWGTNQLLLENEEKLRTKVRLLAIMEMTFRRAANERQVTFADVAKAAVLPEDQVELYVMKAIAKGLVVGKIDEVEKTITMTWVLPRVLNTSQIVTMRTQVDEWQKKIVYAQTMMREANRDVSSTSSEVVL